MWTFIVFQDDDYLYHWRLVSADGTTIAVSAVTFSGRRECTESIERLVEVLRSPITRIQIED